MSISDEDAGALRVLYEEIEANGSSCRLTISLLLGAKPLANSISGLEWHDIGALEPLGGIKIQNEALSLALKTKQEFDQTEWDSFEVSDLSYYSYVKSGEKYFMVSDKQDSTSKGSGYDNLYPINALRNLSLGPVDDQHLVITMDIDNIASPLLSQRCSDPLSASAYRALCSEGNVLVVPAFEVFEEAMPHGAPAPSNKQAVENLVVSGLSFPFALDHFRNGVYEEGKTAN